MKTPSHDRQFFEQQADRIRQRLATLEVRQRRILRLLCEVERQRQTAESNLGDVEAMIDDTRLE